MHVGKNFSFLEVITWTRKDIYGLLFISAIPFLCFELLDWKWLAIPWLPIALLGTAVAFVVGFKNNASYDRMWEAQSLGGHSEHQQKLGDYGQRFCDQPTCFGATFGRRTSG